MISVPKYTEMVPKEEKKRKETQRRKGGENEVPVPVVSAAQHPALAAAGTRSREEGEKMRELGVRNSLRTEGAAWARAPGQRHRDRNVTSDFLSVKPVAPFP
jgi:hypothetical protein